MKPKFIGGPPICLPIEGALRPVAAPLRSASGFSSRFSSHGPGRGRSPRFGLPLAAAALAVACGAGEAKEPRTERRPVPNIVFLLSDDQAFGTMGHDGEPWMHTPGMDRLAAEGARFTRAFVTTSLCSPARASFLSGRWARGHKVLGNERTLPLDLPTFATVLTGAGYDTAYFGKWHMKKQRRRPGFAVFASFIGQGKYQDCVFQVNGEPVETEGWVDDVSTDYALEFLHEDRDAPFLLCLGFKAPHTPREPPERLSGSYDGATLAPPPNVAAIPPFPGIAEFATLVEEKGIRRKPYGVTEDWVGLLGEERVRHHPEDGENWLAPQLQLYHEQIAGVDENVVRILDALDELDLAEDTIVVFAGDNGMCNGAHGTLIKRVAYEESIRIPFLVRYPPLVRPGTSIDRLALNVDLAPTLLELAGVAVPVSMQGRSLVPLFEDADAEWRTSFVYEYFYERPYHVPTLYCLRTETWKLVQYPGRPGWTELFHLAEDPYEIVNLAGSEEHAATLAELSAELAERERAIGPRPPRFK